MSFLSHSVNQDALPKAIANRLMTCGPSTQHHSEEHGPKIHVKSDPSTVLPASRGSQSSRCTIPVLIVTVDAKLYMFRCCRLEGLKGSLRGRAKLL